MQRLAKQDGAIAVVITTQGEERALIVRADQPETLSGNMVDNYAAGQAESLSQVVALPFDSLAVIYYTEPASERLSLQKRLPWKGRFPEPHAVGTAERALSCQALDTELARAEALHWVARSHEATPYTGAEKMELHAKHTAVDVGVAALLIVALAASGGAGGGGGCWIDCGPPNDGAWHVDLEGYRWAISAIDEREEGLLRLKKQSQCTGRATVQADSTDLAVLAGLDAWKAQQSSAQMDEHALLAKRTEALDQLGPKLVPDLLAARALQAAQLQAAQLQAAQQLLPPDEHVDKVLSNAIWFGETSSVWARARKTTGGEAPQGEIVVTDKSLLFASEVDKAVNPNASQVTVEISYAQVEKVEVGNLGLNKWVMIRTKDGREQFFSIRGPSTTVDRKSTQAAADLLRAKMSTAPR
jgi:hypothetical protein